MRTCGVPSVPATRSRRPAFPSLNTTTARAPASIAFATFALKVQVPRWSSATAPRGKPAKSASSQPLVDAFGSGLGTTRFTATTCASTRPLPE